MSIPLYELFFEDDTLHQGGDIVSPKWRESPDKAIRSMRVRLPFGDYLFLGGYEEYNLFIETVANLYGAKGQRLCYIYAMGREGNTITSYRIAVSDNGKYKTGDITVRKYPRGQEYDGKPTSGWHKGIMKPISGG
ncbi:MAG: hypothetical protein WC208_10515 [Gallionella sp.]|jgi:hypothetical protein